MKTSHRQALENFAAKKGGEKLHPLDVRNVLLKMRHEKMEAEVRAAFEGYSLVELNAALVEQQAEWAAMQQQTEDQDANGVPYKKCTEGVDGVVTAQNPDGSLEVKLNDGTEAVAPAEAVVNG